MEEIIDAHSKAVEAATMRYVLNLIDRLPITRVIEKLHDQLGDSNIDELATHPTKDTKEKE